MSKIKVTVSLEKSSLAMIDKIGKEEHTSRSYIVEAAIRLLEQKYLNEKLIQGYRAMASEDKAVAEHNTEAGFEAW